MSNVLLKQLAARVRNLFVSGTLQKRYGDADGGAVQVKTHQGRVLEKKESFPYGFAAKAKGGRVLVFCQGGNFDRYEILPVLAGPETPPPELREGDAALYTGGGGYVIVREAGDVEVCAKDGGGKIIVRETGDIEAYAKGGGKIKAVAEDGVLYFGNGTTSACQILLGLVDEIKGLVTTGSPASQTINAASQQKLESYKNKIKELYAEAE
jgi:phage gp45-like